MMILMGQSSTCLILNTCTVCVLQAQLNGLWCCLLVGSSQCLRAICPLLCHFGVSWAAVETYYQQIDTVCVCVCVNMTCQGHMGTKDRVSVKALLGN